MEYLDAKSKYIQAWGLLGNNWGINKAMAKIHALLMVSPEPLSTDEIMEELAISRGNANMNLRGLIGWGIVYKVVRPGERREYFTAEKDIWKSAIQIMKERKKRELDPAVQMLNEVKALESSSSTEELEFQKMTNELSKFANQFDGLMEKMIKAEQSWLYRSLFKMIK